MRRTRFDGEVCPIARVTDLFGDWWTPLVLRELLYGQSRFDEIQDALGISRAILTQRLRRLEDEALLRRVPYQDNPPRFEYLLTDKGEAAWDVLAAMWRYGSDWLFAGGTAPGELYNLQTGETIRPRVVDENSGEAIERTTTRIRPSVGSGTT
jgi:DNA-binding HxlR family transcriptional regulator